MSTLTIRSARSALIPDAAVSTARMLLFSCLGAVGTGLLAQVCVRIPGAPVPFTGQVLGVLLCGALLGRGYGMFSQLLYVGLGITGIPWFAFGQGGIGCFWGPTGGYMVGFVVSGIFLGAAVELVPACRRFTGMLAAMMLAVVIIYAFGVYHLIMYVGSLRLALIFGAWPFALVDLGKALIAAGIASRIRVR